MHRIFARGDGLRRMAGETTRAVNDQLATVRPGRVRRQAGVPNTAMFFFFCARKATGPVKPVSSPAGYRKPPRLLPFGCVFRCLQCENGTRTSPRNCEKSEGRSGYEAPAIRRSRSTPARGSIPERNCKPPEGLSNRFARAILKPVFVDLGSPPPLYRARLLYA
jgi:hypothetical protein